MRQHLESPIQGGTLFQTLNTFSQQSTQILQPERGFLFLMTMLLLFSFLTILQYIRLQQQLKSFPYKEAYDIKRPTPSLNKGLQSCRELCPFSLVLLVVSSLHCYQQLRGCLSISPTQFRLKNNFA